MIMVLFSFIFHLLGNLHQVAGCHVLQSQFNFVNIMIHPLDQGTNCVTVQTKPGQFIYMHALHC